MNRADLRKMSRRLVHRAYAVPINFYPRGVSAPLALQNPLTARLHNKIKIDADPLGGGYAQIVDTNTRVLFDQEDLDAAGVAPKEGDIIEFPDYDMRVRLDIRDQGNGPIIQKWTVSKRK